MGVYIYGHGGSGNHGCEALARTTIEFVNKCGLKDITLVSSKPAEDRKYLPAYDVKIVSLGEGLKRKSFYHVLAKIYLSLFGNYFFYDRKEMKYLRDSVENGICFSIGGDNYCYDDYSNYCRIDKHLKKKNNTLILWGCSVEPGLLKNADIMEDFNRYSLITARESLTYNAMIDAGLKNVEYCPDSAFLLPAEEAELPEIFNKEVVGINVSPMVLKFENGERLTMQNYKRLIDYLLSDTDYNIALIPHVLWNNSNDLETLFELYDSFKNSGRIAIVDEEKNLNCCQLKYIISKCRFMVTARTHASIAAYSTNVPTLVTGYSVKAKGIAADLFGDYKGYVCPVQDLKTEDDLLNAFLFVVDNQDGIRDKLEAFNRDKYSYFDSIKKKITELAAE